MQQCNTWLLLCRNYYVEIFRPIHSSRDYVKIPSGIAIRLGPSISDCSASTRLFAPAARNNTRGWVLTRTGQTFVDSVRRVRIRLTAFGTNWENATISIST